MDGYLYVVEDKVTTKITFQFLVAPTSDINISLSASYIDLSSEALTFTPLNFNVPQVVTLQGLDVPTNDQGVNNDTITIVVTSADTSFNQTKTYSVKVAAKELDFTGDTALAPLNVLKYDPEEHYHYTSDADLAALRTSLINHIWLGGLPVKDTPDAVVDPFIADTNFNPSSANLSKIVRLYFTGENSYVYYFWHCIPTTSNGRAVFIALGHQGAVWTATVTNGNSLLIEQMIDAGYDVYVGHMLNYGFNTVDGLIHDMSGYEDPGVFDPMQMFFDGWIYLLNYVKANFSYTNLYIMGHSGGGWTAEMMTAMFEDFDKGFEVAGMTPLFVTTGGDYEMGVSTTGPRTTYNIANHLDLMSLAAWKREFHCIHNLYDVANPALPRTYQLWLPSIQARVNAFSITSKIEHHVYDYNFAPFHYVSQDAIDIILENL